MNRNLNLKLQSICKEYGISLSIINDTIIATHATGTSYFPFMSLPFDKTEAAEKIILSFLCDNAHLRVLKRNKLIENILLELQRK